MFLAEVNTQIPIGAFRAGTVRRGIYHLCSMPLLLAACHSIGAQQPAAGSSPAAGSPLTAVVNNYCVTCHDSEVKKGGLDLDSLSHEDVTSHPDAWERVVRKLRARQMPPAEKKRPDERTYEALSAWLETALDRATRPRITAPALSNVVPPWACRSRAKHELPSVRKRPSAT